MRSLPRFQTSPHGFWLLLISCVFLSSIAGTFSSKTVRLRSIEIFDTHEWLAPSATIYFHCKGENKTILPDVKYNHFLYTFKGEESWQPLTELSDEKCKRCGLYEMDSIKSDDIFDEWELCPDEFINGEYLHIKEMEFNATFICNECRPVNSTLAVPNSSKEEKRMNVAMVVIVSALVSIVVTAVTVTAYKYWQKRKREQDQARFLKLFDEGDDIEDELGI